MTLKVRTLRCLRRLFIILVSLMLTWFSKKMLISTRCIHGFMSNLIKKSWTDSIKRPLKSVTREIGIVHKLIPHILWFREIGVRGGPPFLTIRKSDRKLNENLGHSYIAFLTISHQLTIHQLRSSPLETINLCGKRFDINFDNRSYSKEKRSGSRLLFWI